MSSIENVQNYWNRRPCNIKHSTEQEYNLKFFEEVEKRRYFVEPHILNFANFTEWSQKKVLEIGCGIGTDAKKFSENGANYTGIDLSENSLEIAKKRFELYGLKGNFYHGNSESLSSIIPIQNFDFIYSFGVIHHTPSPDKVFSEIKKYMDTTSILKIMLYKKVCWKTIEFYIKNAYKFNWNFSKTSQYFAEAQLDCPVAFFYTKKECKNLLKDFDIVKIENKFIFPYEIESYINKIYKVRSIFKILPINILEKYIGQHWLITAKIK